MRGITRHDVRNGMKLGPLHAVRRRRRSLTLPPQGQEPLAPVAQLRRFIIVLARPVKPVRCDARVRVRLAEGEEVDPRLERADLCGNQPVRRLHPRILH